jgi:hypothetical protein
VKGAPLKKMVRLAPRLGTIPNEIMSAVESELATGK